MTTTLKSINITGEICDAGGSMQVEHVYYNHQVLPIEAQYNFCLNTDTTVDSLKVTIGEREIIGKVQEKSQAQKTYTEAISENKRASILTKNGEQYTMTIGNIQPHETIVATHTYIAKLGSSNGKYLFAHPTNVGARYGMESINYHHKNQVMHHIPMNLDNPTHTVYVRIVCKSKSGVKNVTSPTNEIKLERINENEVVVTAMTLPKVGDFSLLIETNNTSAVYESTVDNKKYFMVTHKIDDEEVEYTPKEYIFLLDRSGSMSGQKIKDAVKAIISAIDLIKSDSYFNIMSFGDSYMLLFSKSVIANSESKTKAKHILSTYSADMGGTEIYHCLAACFLNSCKEFEYVNNSSVCPADIERIFVFLTDGQISNQGQVFDLVKKNSNKKIRIFSIGIGNDASRELVETLSKLTGGMAKMVVDSTSIESVVDNIVLNINKKYYTNLTAVVNGEMVNMIGQKIVYPDNTITAFFACNVDSLNGELHGISLTGFHRSNQKYWPLDISSNVELASNLLQKLYVNELINSGELSDSEIVSMSVAHNIMNQLTSFVMVDTVKCLTDNSHMIHIDVPQYSGMSGAAPAACYAMASTCSYSYESRCKEVDALDGGIDMFGGGRSSYTTCSYDVLTFCKPDGSFALSDKVISMVTWNKKEVEKISKSDGVSMDVLTHMLILLHMKKMTGQTADMYITNLEKWLESKYKSLHTDALIKKLAMYVKSPITTHGGDY